MNPFETPLTYVLLFGLWRAHLAIEAAKYAALLAGVVLIVNLCAAEMADRRTSESVVGIGAHSAAAPVSSGECAEPGEISRCHGRSSRRRATW